MGSKIQNELIITISDQEFLIKLYPILVDQFIKLYEANSLQDLKLVELNLSQINGYLEQYKRLQKKRDFARWAAVVISIIMIIGLGVLMYFSNNENGPNSNTILPILNIPLPVLVWSIIGSFASILYRFNNSGDIELRDPIRWLFTRPLIGIVMGAITYLIVRLGFLSTSIDVSQISSPELIWLIVFLSSFSDRFADSLLKIIMGKFTGEKENELINLSDNRKSSLFAPITDLIEKLPIIGNVLSKKEEIKTEEEEKDIIRTNTKEEKNKERSKEKTDEEIKKS